MDKMSDIDNDRYSGASSLNVYPPDDFEGVWTERWRDGQLKTRGAYKKGGLRIGQHLHFWQNGALREVSYWVQGCVSGTLLLFHEDGTRESEFDYGEEGARRGSYTQRSYSIDGRLSYLYVWQNYIIVSRWGRADLLDLEKAIGADERIEKAISKLYPGMERRRA
jgi:hypothetical protein